ncbi:MAG: DUF5655 domain-containing protein [Caulobacteraceae bacterium]|jgi:hypothetical protein
MVENVTERQAKWFASVRASLETSTGKTLEEWVAIAHTCPETGHRARLKWFKETHGLLQNRASYVLDQAFGTSMPWAEADTLIDALWTDPASRAIYAAVDAAAQALPDTVRTARKGYTAWSRKVQFAAARPLKGGGVMLGLAVPPDADPALEAPKNESWSERLKARVRLDAPDSLDERLQALLRAAWDKA